LTEQDGGGFKKASAVGATWIDLASVDTLLELFD